MDIKNPCICYFVIIHIGKTTFQFRSKMEKKQSNFSIALLIFIAVFGITNIPNNYAAIGAESIFWFAALVVYFIPIGLIIAELASYDSASNAGISKWVELGTTKKLAFICGWAYFVENIFYLPMLASRVPVFLSWVFTDFDSLDVVLSNQGNIEGILTANGNPLLFTALAFITVAISMLIAINFETIFEKVGKYIGILSLTMAFGFIVLAIASVFIMDTTPAYPLTVANLRPTLNPMTISTLVWIIFAIGGVETIGTVVKEVENPNQRLPRIVAIGSVLVIVAYAVGVLGMTFIMTPDQLSTDVLENSIPMMFAAVGSVYNLNGLGGVIFLKLVMLSQVLITITALVLWFVATINALFLETEEGIFPPALTRKDAKGRPINAMLFTLGLIFMFLVISNSGALSNIYTTLYGMSTISMVLPFILLIISYFNFKRKGMEGGYVFLKNRTAALIVSGLLLFVTCFAFIFGIVDLPALTSGDMESFYDWLTIAGGGLLFFMLIGYFIYIRREYKVMSSALFAILFFVSGLVFGPLMYIISIVFIIDLIRLYVIKCRQALR